MSKYKGEPIHWFTSKGRRIPIYDGETQQEAFDRFEAERLNYEERLKDKNRSKMTRNKLINELKSLEINDVESKYEEIKEFLKANNVPIKAIKKVTLSDNQSGSMDWLGEEYWEVYIYLDDDSILEC